MITIGYKSDGFLLEEKNQKIFLTYHSKESEGIWPTQNYQILNTESEATTDTESV